MRARVRKSESGIKRTRRRNFVIAAVEVLGIASVFAVGFSAWIFSGGSSAQIGVGLFVANVETLPSLIAHGAGTTTSGNAGVQGFQFNERGLVNTSNQVGLTGYIECAYRINLKNEHAHFNDLTISLSIKDSGGSTKLASMLSNVSSQSLIEQCTYQRWTGLSTMVSTRISTASSNIELTSTSIDCTAHYSDLVSTIEASTFEGKIDSLYQNDYYVNFNFVINVTLNSFDSGTLDDLENMTMEVTSEFAPY